MATQAFAGSALASRKCIVLAIAPVSTATRASHCHRTTLPGSPATRRGPHLFAFRHQQPCLLCCAPIAVPIDVRLPMEFCMHPPWHSRRPTSKETPSRTTRCSLVMPQTGDETAWLMKTTQVVYPLGLWSRCSGVVKVRSDTASKLFTFTITFTFTTCTQQQENPGQKAT